MLKRILILTITIIVLIGVLGCTKNNNTPNLIVKIGDESITIIPLEDSVDPLNEFKSLIGSSDSSITYINIGETVTLDFGDNYPDNISIEDILLNSSGEQMYSDKEIIDVPYSNENSKYYFEVKKHWASYLSSQYVENKLDIRGLLVRAYSKNSEHVYVFVFSTN